MDWMNNPWVVGIGGGVLSGILVTVVSRSLLSRRDRREYVQKLLSANREVIYAIRPGISEGQIPERSVVDALVRATARKYAVDQADLYDSGQIGEELTKEIMDSSFISAQTKEQYCSQLQRLNPQQGELSQAGEVDTERVEGMRTQLAGYRSRMVTMMSGMLGMMTMLMTMVFVFSDVFKRGSLGAKSESVKFLLPAIVAIATSAMAAAMMLIRTELRQSKKKRIEASDDADAKKDDERAT